MKNRCNPSDVLFWTRGRVWVVADQKLGVALGSQPTLSRWENVPSGRDLVRWNDRLCEQFIRLCGEQVRQRGEILLDLDSTDDPTHGQQQLSFFNGAYGQHMYHPMLIFERHSGCLLAARLRPGNASSHARIVPMLLRLVSRLQAAFPGVKIKLRFVLCLGRINRGYTAEHERCH